MGTLTGVQKGAVTVSVDSRFDDNRDAFLVHWLKNPSDPAQLLSQTLRSNLEQTDVSSDRASFYSFLPLLVRMVEVDRLRL